MRLTQTPFGAALVSLLRFAWLGGERRELYAFMRSPYSGPPARARRLPRGSAARSRGQLAGEGRGGDAPSARPAASVPRARARRRDEPRRDRRAGRLHASCGSRCRRAARRRRRRATTSRCERRSADFSTSWRPGRRSPARCVQTSSCPTVERATRHASLLVRAGARRRPRHAPCAHTSLRGRVRGRPRGGDASRDDRRRRPCSTTTSGSSSRSGSRGSRLTRPDPVARERYLFYTTCTRARRRLYLAREAATEDGSPRAPSPFWQDVTTLFSETDVERWTRRRSLGQVDLAGRGRADGTRARPGRGGSGGGGARGRGRDRAGKRLGAKARSRARRLRPADPADPSDGAARAGRSLDVRRHGARAVRRLLVDVAVRARRRPARDRRSCRCTAAGTGGAPGPVPVLLGPSEAVRHRPRRSPDGSTRCSRSSASASQTRSRARR